MAAYRFCRTDDIALLVDALNRCWAPYFPDEPAMTPAAFKRSIRDLQVWCSSCMVAFSGSDPIGVLIGAKRPSGTLVQGSPSIPIIGDRVTAVICSRRSGRSSPFSARPNRRRGPRDSRSCVRAVQRMRICRRKRS